MLDDSRRRPAAGPEPPPAGDAPPERPDAGPDGGAEAARGRFASCRWHALQDNGGSPYCSHRDVLPYAGMNGFNPAAWCPDCDLFKVRRSARKHPDDLVDDHWRGRSRGAATR